MKYSFLAIALMLLACLLPMPFFYYVLVRLISAAFFAWIALGFYHKKKDGLMVTFIALALLFQPFIKISLGRTVWNIVDAIVAIGLFILFFKIKNTNGKS